MLRRPKIKPLAIAILAFGTMASASAQTETPQTCPLDNVQTISSTISRQGARIVRVGRRARGAVSSDQRTIDTVPATMQSQQSRDRIYAPQAIATLERIRDRILNAAGDQAPATPPTISVTASPVYGATAYFDNGILFSHQVFSMADGDDEIAFLMAHELAHVINGDTSNGASMTRSLERVQAMQRGIEFAADLADMTVDATESSGHQYTEELNIEEHNQKLEELTEDFLVVSESVVRPVWVGKQEDAADLLGFQLLLKAGYSAAGVDLAMEHMNESKMQVCASLDAFRNSVNDYVSVAQNLPYEQILASGELISFQSAFGAINKKTEEAFRDALIASALPETHRPYDERLKILNTWLEKDENKEYLYMAEDNNRSTKSLVSYRKTSGYRAVHSSIETALAVDQALDAGDTGIASSKIGSVSMKSSYGRMLKRRLRQQQNRPGDASENARLAFTSTAVAPSLEAYRIHAVDLLASGSFDQLQALTDRGRTQFNDPIYFLPEQINAAAKQGEEERVDQFIKTCEAAQRTDIRKMCYAATVSDREDFRSSTDELYQLAGCGGNACTGKRMKNWIQKGVKGVGGAVLDQVGQ